MTRRAALLSLVPTATLALSACGGSAKKVTTTVSTSPPAAASSYRTSQTRMVKSSVHIVFSGSAKGTGQSVTLSGSGDNDPVAHKGTMQVAMTLGGQRMSLSEVLDGTNVYVKSSLFSSFLPSGKTWLKVSFASAAKLFGSSSLVLTSPGTVPALKNVQKVGSATIDGVQTVEYSGAIDPAKLPAAARAALNAGNVTFGPVYVWVGSDGYIHRVKLETSSSVGGKHADVLLTTTFSKFGEKVEVTVPSASDTVDASKMQIPGFGGLGA